MRLYLTLLIFSIHLTGFVQKNTIFINEFVANNTSGFRDIDAKHQDWIELYNSGELHVNLKGYALSDDNNELDKWIFPKIIIPPSFFHSVVF